VRCEVIGAIVAAAETVAPTDPHFRPEFVDGFQHALEAGAVIALVGALLSAVLIRREPEPTPTTRADAEIRKAARWDATGARCGTDWEPQRTSMRQLRERARR
jgi:hypothetical protein